MPNNGQPCEELKEEQKQRKKKNQAENIFLIN